MICVNSIVLVAPVVRRVVAERDEIVLEAARDHVQVDATLVQERERGDHLGDRVRVHVDRLHRDERAELTRALEHDLREEPGVEQPVVGVDQHATVARLVAPLRHSLDVLEVLLTVVPVGGRACRKELYARLWRADTQNCTDPFSPRSPGLLG